MRGLAGRVVGWVALALGFRRRPVEIPALPSGSVPVVTIPAEEYRGLLEAAAELPVLRGRLALADRIETPPPAPSIIEQTYVDTYIGSYLQAVGVPWMSPAAASQAARLLADRFEARGPDREVVEVRTGRPAGDVLREAVASAEFAHFRRPSIDWRALSAAPIQPSRPPSPAAPVDVGRLLIEAGLAAQKAAPDNSRFRGLGC